MNYRYLKSLIVVVLLLLNGCGGGGGGGASSTPRLYGAVAWKVPVTVISAAISTKQTSQANANTLALSDCGGGCTIAHEFTATENCAAVVYGTGKVLTWATGATSSEAQNSAKLACINQGGTFCTVQTYGCHTF